jgi:hypothetical protein
MTGERDNESPTASFEHERGLPIHLVGTSPGPAASIGHDAAERAPACRPDLPVEDSSVGTETLLACVVASLRDLDFGEGERVAIRYPFHFKRAPRRRDSVR